MPEQIVESLIEGGKATAAPPLGPSLGPTGVNIGQVIQEINKKTEAFKGMQVPIKVIVDTSKKTFKIEVGTPPASSLIKKEAGVEKGSGNPLQDKVADILIEQVIKVAKMKSDNLLGKTMKEKVKEICGTCNSMGILVEGKQATDTIEDINAGKYDEEIKSGKTELTTEEKKKLEEEKKRLAADIEKRRTEFERIAKEIIASMEGKGRGEIKAKLNEAKVPDEIIQQLLPAESTAGKDGGKGEAKPAAKKA